jgi:hypothetical protein
LTQEEQVWDILREFSIMPHPAYRLGWGRVSCLACIFGQADQWASVRLIAPNLFDRIARHERDFGKTIHRGKSVVDLADKGTPYPECSNQGLVALALGRDYRRHLAPTDDWKLPPGAFKHCGGRAKTFWTRGELYRLYWVCPLSRAAASGPARRPASESSSWSQASASSCGALPPFPRAGVRRQLCRKRQGGFDRREPDLVHNDRVELTPLPDVLGKP